MAILGGLFSKKAKPRPKPSPSVTSSAVMDFDVESLHDESEHDRTRLHPNTIYQNAAASSSKMKLPFGRSKSKVNLVVPETSPPMDLANSSSPHFSTQSEPPHSLPSPPLKSAVFGGYGDYDNALSTKSLPNVNRLRSDSHETAKTTVPASAGKKSGGLFSWARDRKKSKAPPPPVPSQLKEDSFNLRSFRHVGGPDASALDDTTPLDLPPARPRPRGDSVASDSSQRVSVAAFREMQARRSQAGSPTPQSVSRPSTQIDSHLRSGSPSLRPPALSIPNSYNQPRGRSAAPHVPHRTSTLRSSPSNSNSKSDSDSDSDQGPLPLSVKWKSKSELGHSSIPDRKLSYGPSVVMSPQLRQEKSANDLPKPEKKPSMPVSVHTPARPAAIQSRSPSQPPVRPAPTKNTPKRSSKNSDTSDPSDYSDDDAPLASLVQPRRPGSAMSSGSGRSLPPKPLIDIKSLSNSPLSNSPPVSASPSPIVRSATTANLRSGARSPTNINERLSNLTQGLTRPKQTPAIVSEPTAKATNNKVSPAITGRTTPSRSITTAAITVPPVEEKSPVADRDSSPAPKSPTYTVPSDSAATTPSINTTEFPSIRNPRASLSLDDPTPIKPMPIHHRAPQSGFSVMSRPHHYSTPSTSISTVPSTNSAQKQAKEGEPLDAIGDFTAAMFSQLDVDFSVDERRGSLDSAVMKDATMTMTTKSKNVSATVSSNLTTPASAPTIRTVNPLNNIRQEPTHPARPVLSDASQSPPPVSVSKSTTSSERSVERPRSLTLMTSVPSQPPQPSYVKPQSRLAPRSQPPKPVKINTSDVPAPRSQPQRPVKSSTSDVPAPRKPSQPETAMTSKTQPPSLVPRHKKAPSTTSTSSESSYGSCSSAPSIAPKKQKQPQPQLRPQQLIQKPRSSTVSTLISAVPPSPTKSSANNPSPPFNRPPQRPFAMRNNSPSSSTGDSSSGRLPITPRDGSEIGSELGRGVRGKQQMFRAMQSHGVRNDGLLSASNSEMGLKTKKLSHRKSASYDDSTLKGAMRGGSGVAGVTEEMRRERRRSEAKNAIELGKVMNGSIKLDDDDDPTMGMNSRVSMMNPMIGMGPMGMGMGTPQQNMQMMMGNPWMAQPNPALQRFIPSPPQSTNPQLLAAHHHAMMAAKQAYQLAVAQQAMQAAGDEWERGSTLGWASSASTVMFPAGPRSMYAGSIYGGSEYGGPTSGWGTGSAYGGGFGPSTSNRNPAMMKNHQQSGPLRNSRIDPSSMHSPEVRHPRPRVKTGPDAPGRPIATLLQQQQQGRGRTPPPPSSWKRGADP